MLTLGAVTEWTAHRIARQHELLFRDMPSVRFAKHFAEEHDSKLIVKQMSDVETGDHKGFVSYSFKGAWSTEFLIIGHHYSARSSIERWRHPTASVPGLTAIALLVATLWSAFRKTG